MKIVVTGAAGFIGSHLCDALLARGDEVVALDSFNDYYTAHRKHKNAAGVRAHPRCIMYEEDIRDRDAIDRIFAKHKPEAVAHLAGHGAVRYSIGRANLYTEVNIVGSTNLLEAARQNDVGNFTLNNITITININHNTCILRIIHIQYING